MRRLPTATSRQTLALIVLLVIVAIQAPPSVLAASPYAQTGPSKSAQLGQFAFSYDTTLVSAVTAEQVPELIDVDMATQSIYEHVAFTLTGADTDGITGVILLFPLATDSPFYEVAQSEKTKLLAIASERPDLSLTSTLSTSPNSGGRSVVLPDALPEAPPSHYIRDLTERVTYLNTDNNEGIGLRYLTRYTWGGVPFAVDQIEYVYQGLGRDGRTWIFAMFSIQPPAGAMPTPDPATMADAAVLAEYTRDLIGSIQRAGVDEFTPSLADIDAMIATLTTRAEATDKAEQRVGGQIAFLEGADGKYEVEVYDSRTQATTVIGSSADTEDAASQLYGWSLEGEWLVVTNFGQAMAYNRQALARVSPDSTRLEELSFFDSGRVLAPLTDGEMLSTSSDFDAAIVDYDARVPSSRGWAVGGTAAGPCFPERLTAVGSPTYAIAVGINCGTGPSRNLEIQKLVGLQESGGSHAELGEVIRGRSFDSGDCQGSARDVFAPALSRSAKLAYVESDDCHDYDPVSGEVFTSGGSRILLEGSTRALVESPQRIESISWSPDEQWITYGVRNGLYAVQVATGAVVKLYTGRNTIKDVRWNPTTQGGQVITPDVATNTPTVTPTSTVTRTPTATPTPELIDVPVNAVTLDSRGDDTILPPGATFQYWVNVRNSGTLAWTKEHYGFRRTGQWAGQPPAGAVWRDVAPGSILSFSEKLTAPTVPGLYSYGFIMQHDGRDFGPEFAIKVTVQDEPAAKDEAEPDGACRYYEVAPGATYQMTYTIRNTGTSTWTPADYVFLLVDATGQPPVESAYRLTGGVPPGGAYTFTETLQVPQQPGEYHYNYFMRHGDKRFGFSCNTTVRVAQQTDPGPTPPGGEEKKTPEPKRLRFESRSSTAGVPNWPVGELKVAGYDEKGMRYVWPWKGCQFALASVCPTEVDVQDKWWTGVADLSFTLHTRVSSKDNIVESKCLVPLDQIDFSWWRRFWDRLWGKSLLVTVTYNTTTEQCSIDPPAKPADK